MGENLLTNKIPVVDVSYEAVKELSFMPTTPRAI